MVKGRRRKSKTIGYFDGEEHLSISDRIKTKIARGEPLTPEEEKHHLGRNQPPIEKKIVRKRSKSGSGRFDNMDMGPVSTEQEPEQKQVYMSKHDRREHQDRRGIRKALQEKRQKHYEEYAAKRVPTTAALEEEREKQALEAKQAALQQQAQNYPSSLKRTPGTREQLRKEQELKERLAGKARSPSVANQIKRQIQKKSKEFADEVVSDAKRIGKNAAGYAKNQLPKDVEGVLSIPQKIGEEETRKYKERIKPDFDYIESGGTSTGTEKTTGNVRINPTTRHIEVRGTNGWRDTGRKAVPKVPKSISEGGIEYEPERESEYSEFVDEEISDEYSGRNDPMGWMPEQRADKLADLLKRQAYEEPRQNGVSSISSGIYATTTRPPRQSYAPPAQEYQDIPMPNVREPALGRSYGAGLAAFTSGAYKTTFGAKRAPQQFTAIGRNPNVSIEAQQMPATPPKSEMRNKSAINYLFGDMFSNRSGSQGSVGSSTIDTLFSGNTRMIGSTVGFGGGDLKKQSEPLNVHMQQPSQRMDDGLFQNNMKNLGSGAFSLFGGQRTASGAKMNSGLGSSIISAMDGNRGFISAFAATYGKKQAPLPQNTGEPKMSTGTIELFRSTKNGMLRIRLTTEEYATLSQRKEIPGLTGFYRVNGRGTPYKAYLAPAEIQQLQNMGRIMLTAKGSKR